MQKKIINFNNHSYQIFLRDEADASVVAEIFKLREYRAAEDVIRVATEPILDVGAHAGFFSLYCRALNQKVKIFAVEPEADNIKMFNEHIKINKITGVKLIAGALAGETGERELVISEDSHNHRLAPIDLQLQQPIVISNPRHRGEKSLSQNNGQRSLVGASLTRDDNNKVAAYSLADFFAKNKITGVSLLKMDIEGGEYEVLENAPPEVLAVVKAVILEYHTISNKPVSRVSYKQVEEKLRENGFSAQIFPSKFDKTMGFLFARNKRV